MPNENLVSGLHRQIRRIETEVIPEYQKIATGWAAVAMMQRAVRQAEEAMNNGDVVDMIRAYKRLEGFDT